MLMTARGAQKVFASCARELYLAYNATGRSTLFGLTIVPNGSGYIIESCRFAVNVSASGKFSTSKAK